MNLIQRFCKNNMFLNRVQECKFANRRRLKSLDMAAGILFISHTQTHNAQKTDFEFKLNKLIKTKMFFNFFFVILISGMVDMGEFVNLMANYDGSQNTQDTYGTNNIPFTLAMLLLNK